MKVTLNRFVLCATVLATAGIAGAQTYGNTTPFEAQASHSPNYVLGVQVVIPDMITLQSFGLIYGLPGASPSASNAIFGLYSSNPTNGLPLNLMAVTNPINVNTAQTYDNIAFTSTPVIASGTYWMMTCFESFATPRISFLNGGSLVAYWSNSYASGMPATSPGNITYTGQNFNYWVNGTVVPEPATFAVFGLGALAVVLLKRRR